MLDSSGTINEKTEMNKIQFYIGAALGATCLVLSIAAVAIGQFNQRLQIEAQTQQAEVSKGSATQQIGNNILQAMAQSAGNNEKMKAILAKNGFNLQSATTPEAEKK